LNADVIVVGGGVIGLCGALALSERKLDVLLVSEPTLGEASRAAAGMLAPSVERSASEPDEFGIACRDRYPSYLEFLSERTGMTVPLNRLGILQVALTEKGIKGLRGSASPTSEWLDGDDLIRLEPSLTHALGAVLNPLDGSVDNIALTDALSEAARREKRITFLDGRISEILSRADSVSAITRDSKTLSAPKMVLAAGAWSGTIAGARFASAVTPVKGQLISFHASPLEHVVYGPRGYVVPRSGFTIGGSTTESTGFDSSTTEEGIAKITSASREICPSLELIPVERAWGGLRPGTPDALPIIGEDPEMPSIVYACGHGRNGILMAPLTGDIIADLVTASPLRRDLVQFRPDRF
jgi:glycine oxidase ThiO